MGSVRIIPPSFRDPDAQERPSAMPSSHRLFTTFMATALFAAGCSSASKNPVRFNTPMGPDDRFANRVLDPAESRQVLEILRESVDGPADDPARPAKHGVRWEDIRLAAARAGGKLELAIVSVDELDDGRTKRINMVSIGSTPVTLTVRSMPPPRVYAATATAGLFEEQTRLADSLVSRFDESMKLYGAKPSWPPLRND